jgi:hypothetical protein
MEHSSNWPLANLQYCSLFCLRRVPYKVEVMLAVFSGIFHLLQKPNTRQIQLLTAMDAGLRYCTY